MLFAQLSHALSLNDICDCLRFHKGYLSQIRDCVPRSRNGLAHANATRDATLAEELFWTVLEEIKSKYPKFIYGGRQYPGMPWRFKRAIHVVDSTTICASPHGWATGKGRSVDFLPSSKGCFGVNGTFRLCSNLSRRMKTACRHPSGYPTFSCSSTSATSEPETLHLTKPLFQNGSLSRSRLPAGSLFSFFMG